MEFLKGKNMNKRILVTGGKGFIGSYLCKKLDDLGWSYVVVDLKSGSDICGIKRDDGIGSFQVIVNLAAVSSIPKSWEDPKRCFTTNVYGIYNLIQQFPDARFINISTSAIFSDSPYSISKRLGERIVNLHDGVNIRPTNVFGFGDEDKTHVIPAFIENIKQGKRCEIYGDGTQRRDFIYVEDLVDEIIWFIKHKEVGTFDAGYGENMSINELYKKIASWFSFMQPPIYKPARKGDFMENKAFGKLYSNPRGFGFGLVKTMNLYEKL